MKTLPVIAFLAALAAFVLLPISFNLAATLFFVTGITPILIADYTRPLRPLRAVSASKVAVSRERFRLAA
jgi:hypothetical protein